MGLQAVLLPHTTPTFLASMRALQCVAFAGFSLAVMVTILSRTGIGLAPMRAKLVWKE